MDNTVEAVGCGYWDATGQQRLVPEAESPTDVVGIMNRGWAYFIAAALLAPGFEPEQYPAFTLALWFRTPTVTAASLLAGGSSTQRYGLSLEDDTGIPGVVTASWWVSADGITTYPVSVTQPGNLVRDTWTLVVAWMDGGNLTVGVQLNDADATAMGPAQVLNTGFSPGLDLGGGSYAGSLDALMVWNRALSPAERAELYSGGAGRPYPFQ